MSNEVAGARWHDARLMPAMAAVWLVTGIVEAFPVITASLPWGTGIAAAAAVTVFTRRRALPRVRYQAVAVALAVAASCALMTHRADPAFVAACTSGQAEATMLAQLTTQPRAYGQSAPGQVSGTDDATADQKWWAEVAIHAMSSGGAVALGDTVAHDGTRQHDGTVTQDRTRQHDGRFDQVDTGEHIGASTSWLRPRAKVPATVFGQGEMPDWSQWVVVTGSVSGRANRSCEVVRAKRIVIVADAPVWARWADPVRAETRRVSSALSPEGSALVPGVAIGDTSGLSESLETSMRVAGLTHLTAVSGAHFAILGSLAWLLLGFARVPGRYRGPVILVLIGTLVVLVRPEPSVVRAAAMAMIAVLGMLLGRRASPIPSLSAGIIALLLADPGLALSIGFALSVGATAGLVLIAPTIERRLTAIPALARPHVAMALSAQLACAPIIVLISPTMLGWAVAANLLVAPVVPPLTVLGAIVVATASWAPPVAQVAAWCADWCAQWIALVARVAAAAPGAELTWLPGAVGAVVMVVVSIAVVVVMVQWRHARWYADAYVRPVLLARRRAWARSQPRSLHRPQPGHRAGAIDSGTEKTPAARPRIRTGSPRGRTENEGETHHGG